MTAERIYKVIFRNQDEVYEIYARGVSQSTLLGFVEVEALTFGERSAVVVDPAEERLKTEFADVKRTYLPMHAIVRIDEVAREGVATVSNSTDTNVMPFPYGVSGHPGKGPASS